jgi:large subunit ribosomal protein L29
MAKEKLDLKSLSDLDIKSRIDEEESRLKKLKFSHAVSPLENPLTIRHLRKELARLKTEVRRRQLAAQQA